MVCAPNVIHIVAAIAAIKILIIILKKENTMRRILKNDFHNTEVNLNVKNWNLSANQIKRARKILCGIDGCTCGNVAGMRGSDNPDIEFDTDWVDNKYIVTGIVLNTIHYEVL